MRLKEEEREGGEGALDREEQLEATCICTLVLN